MTFDIKTFADNPAVAAGFAAEFKSWLDACDPDQKKITIAVSGGSTPKLLFAHLAENYADSIDWSRLHFFWGDDRCVQPDDPESNYGEAKKLLLDQMAIPTENIHRVRGEDDPVGEAIRYGSEIAQFVPAGGNGLPQFDLMMLGMGGDGHTASIFPHQMELLTAKETCVVATHPESGQKRISLSGPVINASKKIVFLITGAAKESVLKEVINQSGNWQSYPISHVKQQVGNITIFTDINLS